MSVPDISIEVAKKVQAIGQQMNPGQCVDPVR